MGPEAVADREEESDAAEAVTMTHGENEGALDKKGGSTQGTRRKGAAAFRQRGQCLENKAHSSAGVAPPSTPHLQARHQFLPPMNAEC